MDLTSSKIALESELRLTGAQNIRFGDLQDTTEESLVQNGFKLQTEKTWCYYKENPVRKSSKKKLDPNLKPWQKRTRSRQSLALQGSSKNLFKFKSEFFNREIDDGRDHPFHDLDEKTKIQIAGPDLSVFAKKTELPEDAVAMITFQSTVVRRTQVRVT